MRGREAKTWGEKGNRTKSCNADAVTELKVIVGGTLGMNATIPQSQECHKGFYERFRVKEEDQREETESC
jgi:hypothetical protein